VRVTAAGFALGPAADYLPHQPPMRLIDDIVEVAEHRVVCRTTIHPDCVFAIDGVVHPSAMIEFVAQACAIYARVRSAEGGDPPHPYGLLAETERSPEHRAKPEAPDQRSEGSAESDGRGGRMKYGLLAACREIAFAVDSFAIGDELTIVVNKVFSGNQMAAFTGTVARGDVLCATLELSVVDAELAAMQRPTGEDE
jgi:predicted hotdog family 3-hydroxylacyl-ACP dehydratase